MGRTILAMEGREHIRHRNLVVPFFGPGAMRGGMEAEIGRIARDLIAQFVVDGHADLVPQGACSSPVVGLAFRSPDRLPVRFG
jgi:cytochrome P450